MNGDNPYAPPTISETETKLNSLSDGWKVYGTTLIVRKGATLPKIDLETGICDPSLQLVRCPHIWLFGSSNSFWSYADPRRTFFFRFRHFIGEMLVWPLLILLAFVPGIDDILPSFAFGFDWFIIAILIHTVWRWLDRPKLKIEASPKPGWLRLTRVHPDALEFLRRIAAEQTQDFAGRSQPS